MGKKDTAIKAADVLERSFELIISLKVVRHDNPLAVVVLDELETHLKDLRSVMADLRIKSLDETSAWKLLWILFWKFIKCLIKFFNITQSCKYCLNTQVLNI